MNTKTINFNDYNVIPLDFEGTLPKMVIWYENDRPYFIDKRDIWWFKNEYAKWKFSNTY